MSQWRPLMCTLLPTQQINFPLLGWKTYRRQAPSFRSEFAPPIPCQEQVRIGRIYPPFNSLWYCVLPSLLPMVNLHVRFMSACFTKCMQLLPLPLKSMRLLCFLSYGEGNAAKVGEVRFIVVGHISKGSIFKNPFCFMFFSRDKADFVFQHILQVSRIKDTPAKI